MPRNLASLPPFSELAPVDRAGYDALAMAKTRTVETGRKLSRADKASMPEQLSAREVTRLQRRFRRAVEQARKGAKA